MKRDTKIVLAFLAAIPAVILSAASLCSLAIAQGASMQWRVLFRLMCHGRVERCLELFGAPMPICARCTGIYVGLLAGLFAFPFMRWLRERTMRAVAFIAIVPLGVDGVTQLLGFRESVYRSHRRFGLWIVDFERGGTAR